jgi:hypothetical protein
MSVTATEVQGAPTAAPVTDTQPKAKQPFGDDGFTFGDFLDIINPLQHIPVVSSIYRRLTGDTIDNGAQLAGDCLFGGPLGYLGYVANSAYADGHDGQSIGDSVVAFFAGPEKGKDAAPETMVADASASATAAGAAARFEPAAGSATDDDQIADIPEHIIEDDEVEDAQSEKTLFNAAREESGRRAQAREEGAAVPNGAIASEGGWFSDVMLSALDRYKQAARLPKPDFAPGQAIDAAY